MKYRSLGFLIVVFSLCSADLFLFSGVSSRPAGVLTIYSLVFEEKLPANEVAISYSKIERSKDPHIARRTMK